MIINGVEIDLSKLENRLPENKVKAIKEVREKTGASLEEAKTAVDVYVASCQKEPQSASYCSQCGAKLSSGAKFCGVCGTPVRGGDSSGQTSGQEWQQLADSAKVVAKASVENARKNVAKGLGAAGEKIVSAADKMQQSGRAEEIPKEPLENGHTEQTGPRVQSADIGVGAERTSPDHSKDRKKWKLAARIVAIIVVILLLTNMFVKTPVADVKSLIFDQYGSQTLGEAVKTSIPEASWNSEKLGSKHYTVTVSGFCPDLYSNIQVEFDVNYSGDYVYASPARVIMDGDTYNDIFSIAIVMSSIYSD